MSRVHCNCDVCPPPLAPIDRALNWLLAGSLVVVPVIMAFWP